LLLPFHAIGWPVQAPLVEQTIYLKHTQMCLGDDDCDSRLLLLIRSFLSKRGTVEVESRKMRVTVTDEKQRVAAVVKFVRCYDKSQLPPDQRKDRCS
jgi:GrpB-like predicted nucleotidyltransferase (UPF0157 family)